MLRNRNKRWLPLVPSPLTFSLSLSKDIVVFRSFMDDNIIIFTYDGNNTTADYEQCTGDTAREKLLKFNIHSKKTMPFD